MAQEAYHREAQRKQRVIDRAREVRTARLREEIARDATFSVKASFSHSSQTPSTSSSRSTSRTSSRASSSMQDDGCRMPHSRSEPLTLGWKETDGGSRSRQHQRSATTGTDNFCYRPRRQSTTTEYLMQW